MQTIPRGNFALPKGRQFSTESVDLCLPPTGLSAQIVIKGLLDAHNMRATSLELLSAWPNAANGEHLEQLEGMMAAAAVFEPELVMVGCLDAVIEDRQQAIANLRQTCREVAGASFQLGLEFLPWSALPDIPAVRSVVEEVGEDVLGYVLDTWHFIRAGSDYDALAQLPGEKLRFIQASDARPLPGPDLLAETLGDRVGPDDGVLDWPRMLETWRRMGIDCPIGTEMFSNRVKAMPLDDACRYLYDCLQQPFRQHN